MALRAALKEFVEDSTWERTGSRDWRDCLDELRRWISEDRDAWMWALWDCMTPPAKWWVIPCRADGNCQFIAAGVALHCDEMSGILQDGRWLDGLSDEAELFGQMLRLHAVRALKSCELKTSGGVTCGEIVDLMRGESTSREEYLRSMATLGTWGDHGTLTVLTDLMDCRFEIWNWEHGRMVLNTVVGDKGSRVFRLLWRGSREHDAGHYDCIVPGQVGLYLRGCAGPRPFHKTWPAE